MANITVTYTFSNGTTADAGEVNTNFTDIINGTSDGTKDFSINALTVAGTATLNGAVNLGNATADDITFNGRVASDIDPKTAASNTLGDATQTWQALYLDNTSTDGGAIYFDGGSTKFIKSSADGADLDLGGFSNFDLNGALIRELGYAHVAKSADYTVDSDTTGYVTILMTTGSSTDKTVTLPAVASSSGRVITIKKVDSGTNACIVDGNSTETIDDGTTVKLLSQYDFITVMCDGSEWHIIDKYIKDRFETKNLSTSNGGTVSFTGLDTNKYYEVTVHTEYLTTTTSASQGYITCNDSNLTSQELTYINNQTTAVIVVAMGFHKIYNPSSSTLTLTTGLANGCTLPNGTATVRELNATDVTTAF